MAILSLGITSYKFYYPILGGISLILRTSLFSFFPQNSYSCSLFFNLFLINFGMLLCFIFELISLLRQRKGKNITFKNVVIEFFAKYKTYPGITFFLLLLAIIDFIGTFLNNYLSTINSQLLSFSQLNEFFFVILLNYLFLKQSIHRHHFVALIFIISGLVLISYNGISFTFYLLIGVLCNLLFAVLDILEKWLMDFRFLSPYELIGFKGLYGNLILTCILIVGNLKCKKWMRICEYDEHNPKNLLDFGKEFSNIFLNWYYVFQVLGFLVLTLLYNIFHELTLKHLGPTHRIIIDGVFSVISMIVSFYSDNQNDYIIRQIIGHVSLIIGIIIYNEIIIVKMCGLDVNTDKQIKERATGDAQKISLLPIPLINDNNKL